MVAGEEVNFRTIALRRLHNERLIRTTFKTPADVVGWLGAVQSQDYAGAKWAVAQRAVGLTDASLDAAFNAGEILRTHLMRPTWHFVTPADIRAVLQLTSPRVHLLNGYYYRSAGMETSVLAKGRAVFEGALQGGRHLTRTELNERLKTAGMSLAGLRLAYMIMHAELEGVLCSGPRQGKQFTYALLDERAPKTPKVTRDEALAALTLRYFTSHGPASIRDFAWWSGLTVKDIKAGLALNEDRIVQETAGDLAYWSVSTRTTPKVSGSLVYLLPNYDEFLGSFKDRGTMVDRKRSRALPPDQATSYAHQLVIDGIVSGAWRRTVRARAVDVEVFPYRALEPVERHGLEAAVERYGRFLGVTANVVVK